MGQIRTFFAAPFSGLGDRHMPAYRQAVDVLNQLSYVRLLNHFSLASLRTADLYIHHELYDPAGLREEISIALGKEAHVLVLCHVDNKVSPTLRKLVLGSRRAQVFYFGHLVEQVGSCVHEFIQRYPLLKMRVGACAVSSFPQSQLVV